MGGGRPSKNIDSTKRLSSSSILANERIIELEYNINIINNELNKANNKINELNIIINNKDNEVNIIKGERLEWQIMATNTINDIEKYKNIINNINNDNNVKYNEFIEINDKLIKKVNEWKEILKREREIRNAYERILINIGYMPNDISSGIVNVVSNILHNTHEHRKQAELQLITSSSSPSIINHEYDNIINDGPPKDFRLPLPLGALHNNNKKISNDISTCHINWKAAVKAVNNDKGDNSLYNIALRLANKDKCNNKDKDGVYNNKDKDEYNNKDKDEYNNKDKDEYNNKDKDEYNNKLNKVFKAGSAIKRMQLLAIKQRGNSQDDINTE